MNWKTMIDQLIISSSTLLLQRVLDDLYRLRQWSIDHQDYAAMVFFDTAIEATSAELKKRTN